MNQIQISNVTISQTESLYSLADLHRASGGKDTHKPNNWLRNQQTQDLIAAIEAQGKQAVQTVNGGSKRGTYVCRELVVSYGMWISAAFALQVIQVFLDAQESSGHAYLNDWEAEQIRAAVKARSVRTGETTQAVYLKLHAFMETDSYLHICRADFQTALNFLASMENAPVFRQPENPFNQETMRHIKALTNYVPYMIEFYHIVEPAVRCLNSDLTYRAHDRFTHAHIAIRGLAKSLNMPLTDRHEARMILMS